MCMVSWKSSKQSISSMKERSVVSNAEMLGKMRVEIDY